MEQIQDDIVDIRNQMDTIMTRFMGVITNLSRGQEELRALLERSRGVQNENEHPEFMFEDIYVGQPRPNATMNFPNLNINDEHANGYRNVICNQGLHCNQGHFHHHRHIIINHILLLGRCWDIQMWGGNPQVQKIGDGS